MRIGSSTAWTLAPPSNPAVKSARMESHPVSWKLLLSLGMLASGSVVIADTALEDLHRRAAVTEIWEPVPEMVTPSQDRKPPSDALVLLGTEGVDRWQSRSGGAVPWRFDMGVLTVVPGSGDLLSREVFEDVQLHVEWRTPEKVEGESQGRGNSGVFLMDRYEVQVLDSFDNPTYSNGQAASVYKQHIPLVNASRGPGEWQSYDIIFRAPRFAEDGRLRSPATVTVLHNGVLVQNHVTLSGPTSYVGAPNYTPHGPAPIRLQDHRNPVSFRNIWVRRL